MVSKNKPQLLGLENLKAVGTWKWKMEEAHSEIVLNVEPSKLPHIRELDATKAWANLK